MNRQTIETICLRHDWHTECITCDGRWCGRCLVFLRCHLIRYSIEIKWHTECIKSDGRRRTHCWCGRFPVLLRCHLIRCSIEIKWHTECITNDGRRRTHCWCGRFPVFLRCHLIRQINEINWHTECITNDGRCLTHCWCGRFPHRNMIQVVLNFIYCCLILVHLLFSFFSSTMDAMFGRPSIFPMRPNFDGTTATMRGECTLIRV